VTWDEWGIDVPRLCVANAISAREHGAEILNHAEVADLLRDSSGAVTGVRVKDLLTGETHAVEAPMTLNCAGPWVRAAMAGVEVRLHRQGIRRLIGGSRLAITSEHRRAGDLRHAPGIERRTRRLHGDLDELAGTQDEVEYLVEGMEHALPGIRDFRRTRVMAAVRPTLYAWGKYEDDLSRRYEVFDHEREGVRGFVTLAGGKLAAYRLMAEDATDACENR
jgi:glycerol-3-phosphate dehydrogenase